MEFLLGLLIFACLLAALWTLPHLAEAFGPYLLAAIVVVGICSAVVAL